MIKIRSQSWRNEIQSSQTNKQNHLNKAVETTNKQPKMKNKHTDKPQQPKKQTNKQTNKQKQRKKEIITTVWKTDE